MPQKKENFSVKEIRTLNDSKAWFNLYAIPLLKHWEQEKSTKRTKEGLYKLIANISKKEYSTVKGNFVRYGSISKEYISIITCLLIETDFYSSFFDLSMVHRLDLKNTERESWTAYQNLQEKISKQSDPYWQKWLEIYRLRYTKEEKGYQKRKSEFEAQYEEVIQGKHKDIFKKEISEIEKQNFELAQRIAQKKEILDFFYEVTFILTYRSFLHSHLGINSENSKRTIDEMNFLVKKCDESINKLAELIVNSNLIEYKHDLRMLQVYHYGNKIINPLKKPFKSLELAQQEEQLNFQKDYLKLMRPRTEDSREYRIWFSYYEYLHLQGYMEYYLNLGLLDESLGFCDKSISKLNKLDEKIRGGHLRLHLKIKYNLRVLYYIKHTIEAYIVEKSQGQSATDGFYQVESLLDRRKNAIIEIEDWLQKIYKGII